MLKKIQKFLDLAGDHRNSQAKTEAILELMILTMHADRSIKLAENDLIREFSEAVDWQSGTSISYFVDATIGKVRASLEKPERLNALIVEIGNKLPSSTDKIQAIQACKDMAGSDEALDEKEAAFIRKLEAAFGLESSV